MDFKVREEELEKRTSSRMQSRTKVHGEVKSMLRKFHFNSMVANGMSPVDAARRLGVKLPFGRRIRPNELMKKVEELKK